MSNVYVSSLPVPRTFRNRRIYGGNSGDTVNNVSTQGGTAQTPKVRIDFTSAMPTISDYNTNYATVHGQYPTVRMVIIIDANTEYESAQRPQITKVDGLIDTIYFDIGELSTGYIILQ